MKTKNTANCPVKTKGLALKPYQGNKWIDQHGRVLEVYTNKARQTGLAAHRRGGVSMTSQLLHSVQQLGAVRS